MYSQVVAQCMCVISGCHIIHLLKQSDGELSETAIEFGL